MSVQIPPLLRKPAKAGLSFAICLRRASANTCRPALFKALALGARAVLIGRPYSSWLAIAGANGVHAVIQNLRGDFGLTMGLASCTSP